MNDQIKLSIDGRKAAFANSYELNADAQKKIDALFKDIEALGKSCTDSADFEAKLAASPLNQRYIDLFTELSQTCKSELTPASDSDIDNSPSADDVAADLAKTEAELAIDGAVQHVRGRAYRAAYDKALKTPVVGDAIGVKNKIDLLDRFKK
jgi:hypothetical protein